MTYRTRTYIAGDWTGDKDAIEQLYKWKNSNYWSIDFTDAHALTQSYDTSLYCSIKSSLCERLNRSKTFILVVGDATTKVTKGNCVNCRNYVPSYLGGPRCKNGNSLSMKSYIEYECDKAIRDGLKIIVLYNKTYVAKSLCPTQLKDIGIHVAMKKNVWGTISWDYESVRKAIMGY